MEYNDSCSPEDISEPQRNKEHFVEDCSLPVARALAFHLVSSRISISLVKLMATFKRLNQYLSKSLGNHVFINFSTHTKKHTHTHIHTHIYFFSCCLFIITLSWFNVSQTIHRSIAID